MLAKVAHQVVIRAQLSSLSAKAEQQAFQASIVHCKSLQTSALSLPFFMLTLQSRAEQLVVALAEYLVNLMPLALHQVLLTMLS